MLAKIHSELIFDILVIQVALKTIDLSDIKRGSLFVEVDDLCYKYLFIRF